MSFCLKLPSRPIDGRDVWPILASEEEAANPHDYYFIYYNRNDLQAVLSGDGRWKLVLPHTYRTLAGRPGGFGGKPTKYTSAKAQLELYDLRADIQESRDVALKHPDVVARLSAAADRMRAELGDELTQTPATAQRAPGRVE